MTGDVFDHLAALDHPLPEPGDITPPEMYDDALDQAHRERYERAQQLRQWWSMYWDHNDGHGDPVLDAIDDARKDMLAAEQRRRLLLAYAREFVTPRPYTLAQLADHAGMSISGIRTAYDVDDECRMVEERTGLRRRPRATASDEA